tara:strand:+ start:272 stop:487 length:216 start_codon:yes stop_codon:yes gene_type:complete
MSIFKLRPYNYLVEKDTCQTKSLGKHAGHCGHCGLMFGTLEIGTNCSRCGSLLFDPNHENGLDEWRAKREQ